MLGPPGRRGAAAGSARSARHDAERAEVAEQEVLDHVEREGLLLAERCDRRDERDRHERDAQAEEGGAPARHRRAAPRQRPGALGVERARRSPSGRSWSGSKDQAEWASTIPPSVGRSCTLDSCEVEGKTYEASGVSLALADSVVERLRAAVESTGTTGLRRLRRPLSARRRALARRLDRRGRHEARPRATRRAAAAAGADLAAHCIDDVLCTGAEPLFFLDYVAGHHSRSNRSHSSWKGRRTSAAPRAARFWAARPPRCPASIARRSSTSRARASGSSTRDRMIDGSSVEAGDVVLGLPSFGLHTNGFSLVRKLVGDGDFDADLLLAPHRLYVDEVRQLRAGRREGARARHRRRDHRQPLARPARGAERRDRLGKLGAAARLRLADRAGGRAKKSNEGSSTSGSGCAPSSPPSDTSAGTVIGRIA